MSENGHPQVGRNDGKSCGTRACEDSICETFDLQKTNLALRMLTTADRREHGTQLDCFACRIRRTQITAHALRSNPFGKRHERCFQVDLFLAQSRERVAVLHEQFG